MFCKNCGQRIPENAKFCGKCGTSVSPVVSVRAKKNPPAGKKWMLCGALLVVALVIILAVSLFGKKTVWLVTEEVWRSGSVKDVVSYAYDQKGRLVEYEDDLGVITYIYKGDQLLKAEMDGELFLEYCYDKKGNLSSIEGDGFEAEVTCDKKGRVVEMEFEGYRELSVEYSYHDNGCIREMELNEGTYRGIWTYSPTGKILEVVHYYSGEKYTTKRYEYDSEDRLLEYTMQKHTIDFTYAELREYDKKGNWIEFTLSQGGEEMIECEVEYDGNTRKAVTVWSAVDYTQDGDTYLEETYDKYGNLVEQITYGDEKQRVTWEYEKRKVAPGTVIMDVFADPGYCLFLR